MEKIKGQCENCGYAFMGSVKMNKGVFPEVKCPQCGQPTENFDYEADVNARDAAEYLAGRDLPVYELVTFA